VTAVELLPPAEAVHGNERWYEVRRQGITASEIAAVLGISRWESPFSLYWRKVNDWRTDDNEFTSAGRHLEDAIAQWWWSDVSRKAGGGRFLWIRKAGLYAHPDRPWQLATPDALLVGDNLDWDTPRPVALLECKWVAYSWDGWGEQGTDEIPVYYRAQCLWQADVLGVDEVHVAALGPGGFRAYVVRRDEDDLALMRKAGEEFHRRLAEQDPPPLDSHQATLTTLKRLHPSVGEGEVEISHALADTYRRARADKKDAEERLSMCEAHLRAALGSDYHRAVCGDERVASRSVFTVRRIDAAAVRERYPEVAAECTTESLIDKLTPARSKS
jgi:putative phage-type endonuclease